MKTYKNVSTEQVVSTIEENTAGICKKTRGMTLVLYVEGDSLGETILIMESEEFHKTFKIQDKQ